ncbi:hypothetical protein B0H19DRAFT_1262026 [Mycena capillaripes]|nr:hypothetical protein B0H19DRAFT_1262026 [Mycena capillaripes]
MAADGISWHLLFILLIYCSAIVERNARTSGRDGCEFGAPKSYLPPYNPTGTKAPGKQNFENLTGGNSLPLSEILTALSYRYAAN